MHAQAEDMHGDLPHASVDPCEIPQEGYPLLELPTELLRAVLELAFQAGGLRCMISASLSCKRLHSQVHAIDHARTWERIACEVGVKAVQEAARVAMQLVPLHEEADAHAHGLHGHGTMVPSSPWPQLEVKFSLKSGMTQLLIACCWQIMAGYCNSTWDEAMHIWTCL